jgi:hypothetical protein
VAGFVAAQRDIHGIPAATVCRALGVSPAWFYKWRHGDPSPQHARRAQLAVDVARLFAAHRGTHGAPRITADLREAGWQVSQNTVAGILHERGLRALRQYFPNGTNLRVHTAEELTAVDARLNDRPRKILDWRTPLQVFTATTG